MELYDSLRNSVSLTFFRESFGIIGIYRGGLMTHSQSLEKSFYVEAQNRIHTINDLFLQVRSGQIPFKRLDELYQLLHPLGGLAKHLGMQQIYGLTNKIESYVQQVVIRENHCTLNDVNLLEIMISNLRYCIESRENYVA